MGKDLESRLRREIEAIMGQDPEVSDLVSRARAVQVAMASLEKVYALGIQEGLRRANLQRTREGW